MKLKNLTLISIIIFLGVSFGACSSDDHYDEYEWIEAYINVSVEVRSDSRGYFDGVYDISTKSDVYDFNDKLIGPYVYDLGYYTGDILILADYPLEVLTLILYDKRGEVARIDLKWIDGGNVENLFDGTASEQFLGKVAAVLQKEGYAEIGYLGTSDLDGRSYMDIDIYMDVDAYIRR